ncbi:hypothetical protein TRVA0_054S00716 [Trichomonascus vanleenenianus]|uniref:NupC/NupG family nucleoside CNT transporter n=1 Tax=Trichomonascus vanleenenianus TaxID=2268995 RepID=UPI003EC9A000
MSEKTPTTTGRVSQDRPSMDHSGTHVHHDPALDPENQHYHEHTHHSAFAHKSPEVHADLHVGPRESTPPPPEEGDYKLPTKDYSPDADVEKHMVAPGELGDENSHKKYSLTLIMKRYRWVFHIFWGMFFTAWWVSVVAQKKTRHKWLIPTLLWMAIMFRLITFYLPTKYILVAADWVWQRTIVLVVNRIPEKMRLPLGALGTVAVILVGTFVTPEYDAGSKRSDRAISFFGCVVAIAGLYLTSKDRSKIVWHTVITGMLLQYIIALFVLRTGCGYDIFNFISFLATELLGFARDGVAFLTTPDIAAYTFFFFSVLPAVIFFIAFVHLWYYWGILQWAIVKFAHFFFWVMRVSGAEAVVAAASPFIGQGESAVLIKPFIPHLTNAEIHQVMTSGFATIAGSVLVAYIGMGVNPQALVSSCVMSIPASLATSKLRYPETEETLTSGRVVIPDDDVREADNVLHAFSNGAWLGIVVAGCILTNLLCIIALVALINALLTWFAGFWGIPNLTLEQIFGYIFYPVAFLLGAPRNELYQIAKLIGVKVIQNEFVGYTMLRSPEYAHLSIRGQMLATYALCGFANLGSVATQIGVLGQLAPSRRGDVSKLAMSSLITGCISTLLSACVAGMVLADTSKFTPVATTSS